MTTTSNANAPLSSAATTEPPTAKQPSAFSPSPADTVGSLQGEAEAARQALASSLNDLKHSLQIAADPCQWAKQHPWIAIGIAAATGFAAISAVTGSRASAGHPSADQFANGIHEAGAASASSAASPLGPAPSTGPSWSAMLFDLAKVLLTTQLVPMIQAWQQAAANNQQATQATANHANMSPDGAAPYAKHQDGAVGD